LLLLKII